MPIKAKTAATRSNLFELRSMKERDAFFAVPLRVGAAFRSLSTSSATVLPMNFSGDTHASIIFLLHNIVYYRREQWWFG
jgi:hypothetical protein